MHMVDADIVSDRHGLMISFHGNDDIGNIFFLYRV